MQRCLPGKETNPMMRAATQIALAEPSVANLDRRIGQLDAMVDTATSRGWTKTAMALVGRGLQTPAGANLSLDYLKPATC
jgi:hypothetical protein